MKKKALAISFSLLFSILFQGASAQQAGININGKVVNAENGRPVRQANITIALKGVGTATNASGQFVLIIPTANLADTLQVSRIGYNTLKLPIAGLKNGQTLNLSLTKLVTELNEVTITHYDALKIIQKAITRIPENNINTPHLLRGFYRMYTFKDDAPLQLSEAVFDVFNFGYGDKRADLFKLDKARNEKNTRDFSSLEFGQKPNTIFEQDIVNHLPACNFLNEDGLLKHDFEVNGIVDVNGYKAYQIDFKEKKGAEKDTYRGQFFIDTKTYAFIYFDYGLSPTGLTTPGNSNFVARSLLGIGGVKLGINADHMRVNYQQVGQRWVLASVEGTDTVNVSGPTPKNNFKAQIKFNYQITSVDTKDPEPFSSKIGRNESINNFRSSGGDKFWKDYNILLSDFDTDAIFKQIQAINKDGKSDKDWPVQPHKIKTAGDFPGRFL